MLWVRYYIQIIVCDGKIKLFWLIWTIILYADFSFWTVNNMLYFSICVTSVEGVMEDRYIFIYV